MDWKLMEREHEKTIGWKIKSGAAMLCLLSILTTSVKMVLILTRYSARIIPSTCNKHSEEKNDTFLHGATLDALSHNKTSPVTLNGSYTFTVAICAIINLLRVVEYILLSYGLITFVLRCSRNTNIIQRLRNTTSKKKQRNFKWIENILLCSFLIPYFILGTAVLPALGIVQEIEHTKKALCNSFGAKVYIAYSAVNVLRYMWDFAVRVGMIATTRIIGNMWSSSNISTDLRQEKPIFTDFNREFAQDMSLTNDYVQTLQEQYHQKGELAKTCNEIFQTWFILPWIIYFLVASLEVGNVLLPWQDENATLTSFYPKLYYLLYNINQLISLLLPYMCTKQMEARHNKYFKRMQFHISSKPFGATMSVHKREDYNFSPRVIGTRIRLDISNPLYFLFLVVGFFFTVCKALL